ncbi:MAG: VWA domain-containing protein [Chthoniobacteraceae bacterium]
MKTQILTRIVAALAALAFTTTSRAGAPPPAEEKPLVQLAILLDTSNSMDGLIAQAKTQLWQIVNEFIAAKQDGKTPRVQVALYEYGNSGLPAQSGHVRLVAPLTDDLDRISESLFALKTGGGDEYCGWVIRDAARDLAWNASAKVYKAIFIAGNEPFTQGPVLYSESCKTAVERGIIVNTIHCGPENDGVGGKWLDGAKLADGKFMSINGNAQLVRIDAPQDKTIAELNAKLNGTYLAYGVHGAAGVARQAQQDANAALAPAAPSVTAERAKTKASGNYSNSAWDLLDAVKEKKLDLAKAKDAELPEPLRKLAPEKREAFVAEKQKERDEIQVQLRKLTDDRDQFVASKQKEQGNEKRLDVAVAGAVREQAAKKAFVFEKK